MAENGFYIPWWAAKWNNYLRTIGLDGRLGRAQNYFNHGNVLSVQVGKNVLKAKVQGSARYPYEVKIKIGNSTISKAAKKSFLSQLSRKIHWLASLSQGEFPEELAKFANQEGISLFPENWNDLKCNCTCFDWAIVCKHAAAAYLHFGSLLREDPCLLFDLKDIAVRDLLPKQPELPPLSLNTPETFILTKQEMVEKTAFLTEERTEQVPSFSDWQWPDLNGELWSILPPAPAISGLGDLKATLGRVLSQAKIKVSTLPLRYIFPKKKSNSLQAKLLDGIPLKILLDQELELVSIWSDGKNSRTKKISSEWGTLINDLVWLPPQELTQIHFTGQLLLELVKTAILLIRNGLVVPSLMEFPGNRYRFQWLPYQSNPQVYEHLEELNNWIPDNWIQVEMGTEKAKDPRRVVIAEKASFILSLLIRYFLKWANPEVTTSIAIPPSTGKKRGSVSGRPNYHWTTYFAPLESPTIEGLFWGKELAQFEPEGPKAPPQLIQQWLMPFEWGTHPTQLSLRVEELEGTLMTLHLEVVGTDTEGESWRQSYHDWEQNLHDTSEVWALHQMARCIPLFAPELAPLVTAPHQMGVDAEWVLAFISPDNPLIRLFGLEVLLPKSLQSLLLPRTVMRIETKASEIGSFMDLESLLSFNWEIALGEEKVTLKEFKRLVNAKSNLLYYKNHFFRVDTALLDRLKALEKPKETQRVTHLVQAMLSRVHTYHQVVVSPEAMQLLESVTAIREVPLPETVNATLRHYQQRGLEWMYKNSLLQMGSILADDMGLGKTLQVLALLEVHRLKGTLDKAPALAVVPTSLVTNWCKEAERFTPHLKVATYHGPNRKMPTEHVHLLVTTYGMVRSDEDQFHTTTWPFLIIDEAQNIKNPSAGQTKATKAIPANCRIALSGTPVENRLLDFWSILDFAQPQFFGSETEFRKQFALPIAQQRDMEVLNSFKALSGPFILRREKSDPNIISDLPEKVIQDHWCNLKPAQAALYKGLVNSGLESLDSAGSDIEHSGLVLRMLTALKQTCNHPVNYLKKGKTEFGESGKAEVLENLVENILEGGEKALIFTQYKEMGELIQQMVSKKFKIEIPFLHGGTTRKKRDEMVQRFQEDPDVPIQLLSLKAGGTGLNLTAATHVIHYDLWWNPAVENQATDRAYRIGQKRNVMVHRLLSVGTLEERIDAMLQAKRELANLTVSSGEMWIGDLSKEELKKLVEFAG